MKMRHVRAVAVAAVVVVALTGARRSGGGGCDDHDSSSSSSSSSSGGSYTSGGSSDYDNDDDYQQSTGGYTGGSSTPSSGPTTSAESDVRITDCVINGISSSQARVTWKYTITNGNSSGASNYTGNFVFKDSSGSLKGTAMFTASNVSPGTPYEGTVDDTVYDSNVAGLSGRCEVSSVSKLPAY